MAKRMRRKKEGKKKEKKHVPVGIAHIKATFNNTIISITDMDTIWEMKPKSQF